MVGRDVLHCRDHFMRPQTLTTTPEGVFGWTVKDTSSAGAPTYTTVADKGMVLTLDAESEAEIVTMYQNDVLPYRLNLIQRVDLWLAVGGVDSVTTIVAGLASAQNDTADSVATHAWFRMQGSASTANIVVETDDTVVDNDDKATGTTLAAVQKKFTIDFCNGLSDVRFFIDGSRVAQSTTFDMSNASSTQNVQLFFQLQKASGTGTPSLEIRDVAIQFKTVYGA